MLSSAEETTPYISVRDLCFSYRDTNSDREVPVLSHLNVDIRRGEYVAMLGHNGSGKSTFAKLLNMILEPGAGKIVIDGKDITSQDITEEDVLALRKKIGMVFQNPDNQLVATIVEEDVAFGPENLGLPSQEIRKRVDEALAFVGMTEFAGHEPHRLSGGQKQRIAIAGILAMMPDCIIFDESTAMLDPAGRQDIVKVMDLLHRERGITIVDITHDMSEAALADRILVLDDGKLIMDGTPAEIFAEPETLTAAGLDVPQFVSLLNGLREAGIPLPPRKIASAQDCVDVLVSYYQENA